MSLAPAPRPDNEDRRVQVVQNTGIIDTNQCDLFRVYCEIAKDLVIEALKATGWKYNEVNISNNVLLREKYGLRIPVAVNPEGNEKSWPFTRSQIKQLIL